MDKLRLGVGLIVLVLTFSFVLFFVRTLHLFSSPLHYRVIGHFLYVDGLKLGSSVYLHGLPIGQVSDLKLNESDYSIDVLLDIDRSVGFLPEDTRLTVASDGLFGERYIQVDPGQSKKLCNNDCLLTNTQGPVILEDLLGKLLAKMG